MRFNTQALHLTAFLLAAVLFLAFSQEWVTGQGGFFGGDLAGIQSVLVPVGSMAQSQFDSILLELWACPLSLITMLGILLYAIFKNAQAEVKDGQDLQAEFPLTKDKIALWLAGMVVAPLIFLGFLNFCKPTIPLQFPKPVHSTRLSQTEGMENSPPIPLTLCSSMPLASNGGSHSIIQPKEYSLPMKWSSRRKHPSKSTWPRKI
jgi:hypothetical protein